MALHPRANEKGLGLGLVDWGPDCCCWWTGWHLAKLAFLDSKIDTIDFHCYSIEPSPFSKVKTEDHQIRGTLTRPKY